MTTCNEFDERAEELAIGLVAGPDRRVLLDHVATCDRCRALLDGLLVISDELLHLAPEAEPTPGFTSRTAGLMIADRAPVPARPGADRLDTTTRRTAARRWLTPVVAAAAAVVIAVGAFVIGAATGTSGDDVEAAPIVSASGASIGNFSLIDGPNTVALVEIDSPRYFEGRRTCVLVLADGSTVEVGAWDVSGMATGAWAAPIDDLRSDPVRMEIIDDGGAVVASAAF